MGIDFKNYALDNQVKIQETRDRREPNVPDGLWIKCGSCGNLIYKKLLDNQNGVCPKCGHYRRLSGPERLALVLDRNSYNEMNNHLKTENVLGFKGYEEKLEKIQDKTGLEEAVLTGLGSIYDIDIAIAVMDSRFLMGSMGRVVGEKLTRLIEYASDNRLPLIIFTASGGARMQEGIISLMQMAKTAGALKCYNQKKGLYISVLTDPTSGGVTASFAMLGDIILGEPNAFIGFAGPRVIRETIKEELPFGFQKSEFLLEHGFMDRIVERKELKSLLYDLLTLHGYEKRKR